MGAVQHIGREVKDPLAGGFYTVREAARLLTIASPSKITAWLQGGKGRAAPIITRQYKPIEGVQELGFWDLIEVRFVEHFRKQGVSLQALRKAAATARAEYGHRHPFALSNVLFQTDRRRVFARTAEETGDKTLLDLAGKQFAMYEVLEAVLAKGVDFDPASGLAREWRPKPKEFPRVALNPLISYGQPVIMPDRVPTAALYRSWKAEGSISATADWFEVSEDVVREAVEFELELPE